MSDGIDLARQLDAGSPALQVNDVRRSGVGEAAQEAAVGDPLAQRPAPALVRMRHAPTGGSGLPESGSRWFSSTISTPRFVRGSSLSRLPSSETGSESR